jgi:hypothetical protein
MLRDASQRAWAVEAAALASCCDAPQHEGEEAPRILAKRTQRAFWPNEAKDHLASSPRKRGPMVTAGRYGSRLSPRCREGRPGRQPRQSRAQTRGCTKWPPGPLPCFRPVIYREWCNSNVSGRRGPMWHHQSSPFVVIRCGTIRRHDVSPSVVIMCFGFEAPARHMRIGPSNPPP